MDSWYKTRREIKKGRARIIILGLFRQNMVFVLFWPVLLCCVVKVRNIPFQLAIGRLVDFHAFTHSIREHGIALLLFILLCVSSGWSGNEHCYSSGRMLGVELGISSYQIAKCEIYCENKAFMQDILSCPSQFIHLLVFLRCIILMLQTP